jgi:hypothetical protein
MLQALPNDMLCEIAEYLTPHNFKFLYDSSCQEMQQALQKCVIVADCWSLPLFIREWLDEKKIKLWILCSKSTASLTSLFRNFNSFNDEPSFVRTTRKTNQKYWHKNGVLHRDHNLPSVEIYFYRSNHWILQYHINGVLVKTVRDNKMKYNIIYPKYDCYWNCDCCRDS